MQERDFDISSQVAENATDLKIDLKKGFLVGGDSAGGNMSAAISLKARDDPFFASCPLTGQYLREPAVVYPEAHPEKYNADLQSLNKYTDPTFLNKESTLRYFRVCLIAGWILGVTKSS